MSQYSTIPLPYESDSQGLMSRMATLDRPVFLDSGRERGEHRRFDILAAEPVAWIEAISGSCSSSDPDLPVYSNDFFNSIRSLQSKYNLAPEISTEPSGALPFQGGLLGYLGYPGVDGRGNLLIQDAYVGAYLWAVVVDHQLQRSVLVIRQDYPQPRQRLSRLLQAQRDSQDLASGQFKLLSPFHNHWSREQYEAAFQRTKDYIRAGDCYQVNLSQTVSASGQGQPFSAYLQLRETMPAPFSAFIGWPGGALLSASPERFLRKTESQVLTQPIKGTRPRAADPQQDLELAAQLHNSEKDRAENLMIVDLLRNDLGRVCELGSIKVDQLFKLQSFSNVHHLVSSVSGQLKAGKDALDLLQACFPGGSITGAPKLRAMQIIQELETSPRRSYCGTAFYLCASGDMDSNITIRSLLWESGRLYCWAGGGIVDDSDSDAEYSECFDKIDRIIKTLSR